MKQTLKTRLFIVSAIMQTAPSQSQLNRTSRLVQWVDGWIPDNFREHSNYQQIMKARIILSLMLFFSSSVALLGTVSLCVSLLGIANLYDAFFITLPIAMVWLSGAIYFRRTGNFTVTGNIFAFIMFSSSAGAIMPTGGWDSPVLIMFMTVPVGIFLVVGKKSGVFWSILTAICYFGFFLTEVYQIKSPFLLHMDDMRIVTTGVWCFSWFIILGCLLVYDRIVNSLNVSLAEERNRFLYRSRHDVLTGAYNRLTFQQMLDSLIAEIDNSRHSGLLVYLHINNLAQLTEEFGLAYSNEFLQKLVSGFKHFLGEKMTIARQGGSDFTLLIRDIEDLNSARTTLTELKAGLEHPVILSDENVFAANVAMGGVLIPDFSTDRRLLMQTARNLMHRARRTDDDFLILPNSLRQQGDDEQSLRQNWQRVSFAELCPAEKLAQTH